MQEEEVELRKERVMGCDSAFRRGSLPRIEYFELKSKTIY
jgi:hypothetical protein